MRYGGVKEKGREEEWLQVISTAQVNLYEAISDNLGAQHIQELAVDRSTKMSAKPCAEALCNL